MKIYIVVGSTGEYSERREWNVCAYKDEDKAATRIEELKALMKTLGAITGTSREAYRARTKSGRRYTQA